MEITRTAGEEWEDPSRVDEYLQREIPFRRHAEDLLADLLPAELTRVLDLGTGDGRLLGLVREDHPQCHLVGIDLSDAMLVRAHARFGGDQACRLVRADLAAPLQLDGEFDAVISGMAIHHLEHDRKRQLFGEVLGLLRVGGVFANIDLAASPTEALHERFRQAIGRTQDDPSDRLADLADQLAWLREAGFHEVDCHFKWRELSLITGIRAS